MDGLTLDDLYRIDYALVVRTNQLNILINKGDRQATTLRNENLATLKKVREALLKRENERVPA